MLTWEKIEIINLFAIDQEKVFFSLTSYWLPKEKKKHPSHDNELMIKYAFDRYLHNTFLIRKLSENMFFYYYYWSTSNFIGKTSVQLWISRSNKWTLLWNGIIVATIHWSRALEHRNPETKKKRPSAQTDRQTEREKKAMRINLKKRELIFVQL